MSPYLTERMLLSRPRSRRSRDRGAAPRAAGRQRVSRGLSGDAISRLARVLGAADAYQAMREPRPYRPRGPRRMPRGDAR